MTLGTDWGVAGKTRHFLVTETTYGTHADPAATDAFLPMERPTVGGFSQPNVYREDLQGSLGYNTTRKKRQEPVPFSYKAFVRPSGSAGTPPDAHPAWAAAFSSYTNTGGTSDVYENDDTVLVNTIQYTGFELAPYTGTGSVQFAYHGYEVGGIICDSFDLEVDGENPFTESFSGTGSDFRFFHTTALDGALSGGESSITVDNGSLARGTSTWTIAFINPSTGAVVDDNSGSGYTLTTISGSTWGVSPNIAGAVADNSQVVLICPDETTTGNPIAEGGHTFTFGGTAYDIQSISVNMTLGSEIKNDEITSTKPHDAIRSRKREVKATIGFHRRNDRAILIAGAYENATAQAIVFTSSGSAGSVFKIELDNAVYDGSPDEGLQNEAQATPSVSFLCLEATSGAGDEITASFV